MYEKDLFVFRSGFGLEEGDTVEVKCMEGNTNIVLITKASTGKKGIYIYQTGEKIIEPIYDSIISIQVRCYDRFDNCSHGFLTYFRAILQNELFLFDLKGNQINNYPITNKFKITEESIILQNKKTKLYGAVDPKTYSEIFAPEFKELAFGKKVYIGYKNDESNEKLYQVYSLSGVPLLKEKKKKISCCFYYFVAKSDSKIEIYSYEGKLIISGNFINHIVIGYEYIRLKNPDGTFSLIDFSGNILLKPGIYSKIECEKEGNIINGRIIATIKNKENANIETFDFR